MPILVKESSHIHRTYPAQDTIKDAKDREDVEECIRRHGAIIDDFYSKSNRIFPIFSIDNARNSARLSLTNERPPRSRKILRESAFI